ncbi:AMP-binding protein [Halomonas sp. AOP42-A1-14]|uniref:AMP-binding protein n=1 Tax=Halomonas sp. AOP42-A1-14 TaxID=3457676 RepID=UPI004034C80B
MNSNFFRNIFNKAKEAGGREFLQAENGEIYTYHDLLEVTGRYASFLEEIGVCPGDRVAVQVDKSPEAYFLYLAVMRMGGGFLPLNTAYKKSEIEYFLSDAEPVVFICSEKNKFEYIDLISTHVKLGAITLEFNGTGELCENSKKYSSSHEVCQKELHDVAIIMYTSGTTGQPKGAMLTHQNIVTNAEALTKLWEFTEKDVLLHALPIFHAHGLFISTHCVLLSKSKILFLSKFDKDTVINCLPSCTAMMGVPTFYTRLMSSTSFNHDLVKNMRLFVSGSAPLLEETSREFTERTGHTILERYGMTESAIISSNPYHGDRKYGSVGKAIEGVEVKIVDDFGKALEFDEVGHVQIRGPAIMKGYWKKPEKTKEEFTEDNWFKTGDLGKKDSEEYLYIVGRHKDLVITGGFNVYPKEVELIIDSMPGVKESAVIGLSHADFGEAVTAIVVLEERCNVEAEEVISFCRNELASYKVPKQVIVYTTLPRNAMGKVVKAKLREELSTLYY